MKRRARWIAAVAIAVAAIAIGWTTQHRPWPAPAPTTIANPAMRANTSAVAGARVEAHPAKTRGSQVLASARPTHKLPDWNAPLAEAVQTLREYAEAGDTDAAVELSWRLSTCTEHALRGSEQTEETLRHGIEDDKTNENLTDDSRESRAKNMERQIDERIEQRNACQALPADLRAGWLTWIDHAAQSGNTAAMRGYARAAIGEYYSSSDVLADVDTAIERRDKARAYLDEALRRGDAEALRDIANAYRDSAHPAIYAFDPAEAYAYAYAGTLAGITRGNDLDQIMLETAASLDGPQLAAAEAQGKQIYEKCCAKH